MPPSETLAPSPGAAFVGRGTPAYRQVSLAFFFMGFASFSLLYSIQPLLPLFAGEYRIGAAEASLALSLSTGAVAGAVFAAAMIAERFGRRSVMFVAMLAAGAFHLAAAFAPGWHALLVLRTLEGLALGGVPAVAMTYLAEEIEPRGLGFAIGLYVAGSGFGGMSGRLAAGVLADHFSWRTALGVNALVGLACAFLFLALAPPSRNFIARRGLGLGYHLRAWAGHLRNRRLRPLFLVALIFLGAFVTLYNYAAFRLTGAPFNLSQSQLGVLFSVYIFGMAASSAGGALADRFGKEKVLPACLALAALGVAITLSPWLPVIILGVVLTTVGFFAGHTVASSWVGPRAEGDKGHAQSLYTLAFYVGSSLWGTTGGWAWTHGGWGAVVAFDLALLGIGFAAAMSMRRLRASGAGTG